VQFINLLKVKKGIILSEMEALSRAETLLRTISILYKPVNKLDYYKADIAYPFFDPENNSKN
jgi:hypothetical protein